MFPYFSMWEINKLIDRVFLQKILKFYYMLNELTISLSKPQSLTIIYKCKLDVNGKGH